MMKTVSAPTRTRYPTIRSGGLFVTLMGCVVFGASLLGGTTLIHRGLFFGGLVVACVLAFGVFWRSLSLGVPSAAQQRASRIALVLEAVLLATIWLLLGQGDPRTFWLAVFFGVGVHFLLFRPVHGPVIVALGVLCMLNALIGLVFTGAPFIVFSMIDGTLKIIVGLRMLAWRVDARL